MGEPLAMRTISLKVAADPDTILADGQEINCEVAEVVLDDEAGDEQRYDVLCPDKSYVTTGPNTPTISIRGLQEWELGAAKFLWDSVGSEILFDYAPYGTAAPSAATPHFVGRFLNNRHPQVGGEVGTFAEIDLEYPIIGAVDMVTTAVLEDAFAAESAA